MNWSEAIVVAIGLVVAFGFGAIVAAAKAYVMFKREAAEWMKRIPASIKSGLPKNMWELGGMAVQTGFADKLLSQFLGVKR